MKTGDWVTQRAYPIFDPGLCYEVMTDPIMRLSKFGEHYNQQIVKIMSIWDQLRGDWEVDDLRLLTDSEIQIAKKYFHEKRGEMLGEKTGIV